MKAEYNAWISKLSDEIYLFLHMANQKYIQGTNVLFS